jgi:NADPH2:quinone reductase
VTETARGAYAEYALAAAERVVPIPDRVTSRQAAAVLLQGMTAHYLAEATYHLTRGDTCLVHAAAGGVGLLLCQIARRMGARVIGTVSTDEKAALARDAGADEVILYTRTDFLEETRRLTGGAGVQVVYDSVGRTTFLKSLDALALRGMLVLYGQSSGPVEPFDPQLLNRKGSLFLTRPTLVHYTATREELLQRAGEVLGWVADGALEVRIGKELPLAQAAEAHHELEGRRTTGKVLLVPCGSPCRRSCPPAGWPTGWAAPGSGWWTHRGTCRRAAAMPRASTWRGTSRARSTSISTRTAIRARRCRTCCPRPTPSPSGWARSAWATATTSWSMTARAPT